MKPVFASLFGLLLMLPSPAAFAGTAKIAAAADLQYALTEIANGFKTSSGHNLQLSFGSSGQFATQIQNGAPFELFLSADESYVQTLVSKQLTLDQGSLYSIGRIVLFAPKGSALDVSKGLNGLKAQQTQIKRFAIANPAHAPYGRAAREALTKAGLWQSLQSKLVLGENAAQAAQFAATGPTQGGIIPYSLALAPALKERGSFALIPADQHAPLKQRMVLTKKAGPVAKAFYAYLRQAQARKVFQRYGFSLPDHQK